MPSGFVEQHSERAINVVCLMITVVGFSFNLVVAPVTPVAALVGFKHPN